jgi:hypothetical protein
VESLTVYLLPCLVSVPITLEPNEGITWRILGNPDTLHVSEGFENNPQVVSFKHGAKSGLDVLYERQL